MVRREIPNELVLKVLEVVTQSVGSRIDKHGNGAFIGPHEALGVVTEEFQELIEAVRSNVADRVVEEWLDVIVSGVWAVASMASISPVNVTDAPTQPVSTNIKPYSPYVNVGDTPAVCYDCDCEEPCKREKQV